MEGLIAPETVRDYTLPLAGSLVAGILIGLERELRAKDAGLRTHTLVCFASALLMLMAAHQGDWIVDLIPGGQVVSDPTRMAHGVLTGIGFLCAGVIFREGATVHGLTTAASLWITAALGLVYGAGLFTLAMAGTVTTLGVLALFRALAWLLPQRVETAMRVRSARDGGFVAADLRRLLGRLGLEPAPIAQRFAGGDGGLELATVVWLRDAEDGDRLAAALAAETGVAAFDLVPAEDAALAAAR